MPHVVFKRRLSPSIKRPLCPYCREEMRLVRVVALSLRSHGCSFECPACEVVQDRIVAPPKDEVQTH